MPVFVFLDRRQNHGNQGRRFEVLGRERVHHALVRKLKYLFPPQPARPSTGNPDLLPEAEYVAWLKGLIGGLVVQGTDSREIVVCGFREGASLLGAAMFMLLDMQLGGVVMIGGHPPADKAVQKWVQTRDGIGGLQNRSMPILAVHGLNDRCVNVAVQQLADSLYLDLGYHNYSSVKAVYLDVEQILVTDGMWMAVWQFVLLTLASEAPEPLTTQLKMFQAHISHTPRVHTSRAPAAVVWLHGITEGSEAGERLVQLMRSQTAHPLADHIEFVFPSLVDTSRPKAGPIDATMWYRHLTMEQDGHPLCYVAEPVSFVEAAALVVRVVEGLVARGIPPQRIVLGGWCQGASIALAALLFLGFEIGGCVYVSGYIPVLGTLRSWVKAHDGAEKLWNRHVPVRAINWNPDRYIDEKAMAATYQFFCTEMAFTRWDLVEYAEHGHEMTDDAWLAVLKFSLEVLP